MPITINGDGTVTGLSVGGLPNGSVTADDLAAGAAVPADGSITTAKLASNAVTTAKLHDDAVTSSKLPSGSVVQVKSCNPVLSGYWANQTDWTDLTGLAITITPKSATNKLLLRAQVHQSSAEGDYTSCIAFKKNGSLLSYSTYQNWGYGDWHEYLNVNDYSLSPGTGQCEREEVAGSTSALTFQVCIRSGGPGWNGNNVYVGRTNRSENNWYNSLYVRSTFRILEYVA